MITFLLGMATGALLLMYAAMVINDSKGDK